MKQMALHGLTVLDACVLFLFPGFLSKSKFMDVF